MSSGLISDDWHIGFFVPGIARPAGSKRPIMAGGRLRAVDSSGEKGRQWRAEIKLTALRLRESGAYEIASGPLGMVMEFVITRPRGHYRKSGILKPAAPVYPITRPDALKLARAVEDSLTGVVYHDDSQIVLEHIVKRYGENNGVYVRVGSVEWFTSQEFAS